jgi:hypothetical protein
MKNLYLSPETHDLVIEQGNLKIATGTAAIGQKILCRLLLFEGEWFLDKEAGVPYYTDILKKGPDFSAVDAILQDEILNTEGVDYLISYEGEYDPSERTYSITFSVAVNGETLEMEVTI